MVENNGKNKIVILGGGITGLTLAAELSEKYKDRIVVVEKDHFSGGLAATLSEDGFSVDLGSHRFHKEVSSKIISYVEKTIGNKLLRRPRKGKVYINNKFIRYPPNIIGLLKVMPFRRVVKFGFSYLKGLFVSPDIGEKNFEEAMIKRGGRALYEDFYRSFAEKLWGKDPKDISSDIAKKRRTLGSLTTVLKRLFNLKDYYLYPKKGIGEIAQELEKRIVKNKGKILKSSEIKNITLNENKVSSVDIRNSQDTYKFDTDILISTIPIDDMFNLVFNSGETKSGLEWRGVRLLYIFLNERINSESETYYFPNREAFIGRVSEVRKYSPYLNSSIKESLLTIEIPCSVGDKAWKMEEPELVELCLKDLIKAKVLDRYPVVTKHFSLKLDKSYPVYKLDWRESFFQLYNKIDTIENLFTIGRRGLFLHCNIDHCITQGIALADIILESRWHDRALWRKKIHKFLKFSARD